MPKRKESSPDIWGLETLAKFLNFDFEWAGPESLEELKKGILIFIDSDTEAAAFQRKLRDLILPVISTAEIDVKEADKRISKLIEAVNKMNFETTWDIDPVDYELENVAGDDSEPIYEYVRRTGPATTHLIRPTKINLLGYDWFMGKATH
jgi:hypothetical protein